MMTRRGVVTSSKVIPGILILSISLVVGCLEIVKVNQPESATVGEKIKVTLDVEVTGDAGSTLVFGFCAPRAWSAAKTTSVSFVSTIGNSTMTLAGPEVVDADGKRPWASQIAERVGFGGNYGEVEWIVFVADNKYTPPTGTDENSPVTGTITLETVVGQSNVITQLGYFLGEADWGYLNDGSNSTFFFEQKCLEVQGATGQAQDLCGPAPRRLINLETYTFNDLLTITFDAQEDNTKLIGANEVFLCSRAISRQGEIEVCGASEKTQMKKIGSDLWQITIWPPSYYKINDANSISELLMNFQNASGDIVVRSVSETDFQVLSKCF